MPGLRIIFLPRIRRDRSTWVESDAVSLDLKVDTHIVRFDICLSCCSAGDAVLRAGQHQEDIHVPQGPQTPHALA